MFFGGDGVGMFLVRGVIVLGEFSKVEQFFDSKILQDEVENYVIGDILVIGIFYCLYII